MQRRTKDAPYAPGKLGIFGGWVEESETVDECPRRELKEETSLDIETFMKDFIVPASQDFALYRHFYLYEAVINDLNFEVYEGDGAEVYTVEAIKRRTGLTGNDTF